MAPVLSDIKDDKFINDIMDIVDEYLCNQGDATVLVDFFSAVADAVHRQVVNQEGERPTLH